jgi:heme-degrading monooxygenase HmoA
MIKHKGGNSMYARIVVGEVQAGKMEEFSQQWQEAVLPDLSREPGFQGVYLLKNSAESKITVIGLWETESHARASEAGYAQQRLPRVAHLLNGKPASEIAEVILRA